MTGDSNASADDPAERRQMNAALAQQFSDAFDSASKRQGAEKTFYGFDSRTPQSQGMRIAYS